MQVMAFFSKAQSSASLLSPSLYYVNEIKKKSLRILSVQCSAIKIAIYRNKTLKGQYNKCNKNIHKKEREDDREKNVENSKVISIVFNGALIRLSCFDRVPHAVRPSSSS